MKAWTDAGGELTDRAEPARFQANFSARPVEAALVTVQQVEQHLGSPAQTLIDGRDRGRVFDAVDLRSGLFTIDNLTLQNGLLRAGGVYGTGAGAGMRASMSGAAVEAA